MNIIDISTELLEAELERRKKAKIKDSIPQVLDQIDWSDVLKSAIDIRDSVIGENGDDDDIHYLYETVMETVFGKDYFKWKNEINSADSLLY